MVIAVDGIEFARREEEEMGGRSSRKEETGIAQDGEERAAAGR